MITLKIEERNIKNLAPDHIQTVLTVKGLKYNLYFCSRYQVTKQ